MSGRCDLGKICGRVLMSSHLHLHSLSGFKTLSGVTQLIRKLISVNAEGDSSALV
ncbi:unnamed protein product [Nezara viridula]|uniref:Uncharacterized protein n=1 Tax=Nezara viridula TaxID=85310 RepID=A0A9P0HNZ2_NEZVI|nr:unnamed protein product [Nezara viridula]